MPIFDYSCRTCAHQFEVLVRRDASGVTCPACKGQDVERLLSLPAIKSESTRAKAMKAAKRRDSRQATENAIEQRKYEESHED